MPAFEPIEAFLIGRCGKTEREAALTSRRGYELLVKGKDAELRERMELARWTVFHIYSQNPYIKPPRAKTPQAYLSFPWETPTEAEVEQAAQSCHVSEAEAAELDRIFAELRRQREESKNG